MKGYSLGSSADSTSMPGLTPPWLALLVGEAPSPPTAPFPLPPEPVVMRLERKGLASLSVVESSFTGGDSEGEAMVMLASSARTSPTGKLALKIMGKRWLSVEI